MASGPSVDVELVALRVPHTHRVVIETLGSQRHGPGGAELAQPLRLGLDPLPAGLHRQRPPAADVDVEVEAVLDGFYVRNHVEPDPRAAAVRVDDAVRPAAQFLVRKPDVPPPVIPGAEPP